MCHEVEEVERLVYRASKRFQTEIVRMEDRLQAALPDETFTLVLALCDLHSQNTAAIQDATARYYRARLRALTRQPS